MQLPQHKSGEFTPPGFRDDPKTQPPAAAGPATRRCSEFSARVRAKSRAKNVRPGVPGPPKAVIFRGIGGLDLIGKAAVLKTRTLTRGASYGSPLKGLAERVRGAVGVDAPGRPGYRFGVYPAIGRKTTRENHRGGSPIGERPRGVFVATAMGCNHGVYSSCLRGVEPN